MPKSKAGRDPGTRAGQGRSAPAAGAADIRTQAAALFADLRRRAGELEADGLRRALDPLEALFEEVFKLADGKGGQSRSSARSKRRDEDAERRAELERRFGELRAAAEGTDLSGELKSG